MRATAHTVLFFLIMLLASSCSVGVSLDRSGGAPTYEDGDPLGDDDDDDAGGDDDDASGAGILNLDPAPDSTGHHYRTPLSATFTEVAGGTAITLFDAYGAVVPTELSWNADDTRVWIWPQPRLEPDSDYSVEIVIGGQLLNYAFATSRVGLLDDDVDPTGAVYSLGFESLRVLSPSGLGTNTQPASDVSPLVQIGEASPSATSLSFGLGHDDAGNWFQDECATAGPIQTSGALTTRDALISGAPGLLAFPLGDAWMELELADLAFDVSPDGESLVEFEVSGWLREASLNALLGSESGCELVASASESVCETCPDSGGVCLWTDLVGISGTQVPVQLDAAFVPEEAACPEGSPSYPGCATQGAGTGGWLALLLAGLALRFRRRAA